MGRLAVREHLHVEREVCITGIGGQGVQLAAQVLARGAMLDGREVMYLGVYGGMMRGGNTDSTVVVADAPIEAPPVVSHTWSAIAMHDEFWEPVEAKLRPGGVVLVNDSTFAKHVRGDVSLHRVDATGAADRVGNVLAASMVMLGAFCALTQLVSPDKLVEAMRQSVPSYRTQHVATNERALREGFALLPSASPAWEVASV
jgi:Pyruvate/2-oxoacid:ferredoxin oxidoreductase gamma subunit